MLFDDGEAPQDDLYAKWFKGATVPALIAMVGFYVFATDQISVPYRFGRANFQGADARAWAYLMVAGALAMHSHYYWGNSHFLARYAELAKIIALVLFIAAGGYLFWRIVIA